MKISEVMTRKVQTVRAQDALGVARQVMIWLGIRHLPVMDEGELAGILSERDILGRMAALQEAAAAGHPSRPQKVRDAMRVPVETIGPDEDVAMAAARMGGLKIGCLVVVQDGDVVGILTSTDVLAHTGAEYLLGPSLAVSGPTVDMIMTRNPPALKSTTPIGEALARLIETPGGSLPVVEDGRLAGMLTYAEVLRFFRGRGFADHMDQNQKER